MGTWIIIAVLLALLGAAGWLAIEGWQLHDVALPPEAYWAMAFGIGFSVVVGVGLMALLFYSARKGYDEPAEREIRAPEEGSR